jgi:hypothetical protein
MRNKVLLPLNELERDRTRHELDALFGKEVLGLPESFLATGGPVDLLRRKLASEPSIRGGKSDEDDEGDEGDEGD